MKLKILIFIVNQKSITMKKKNILAENMKRFATKNLSEQESEQEKYQTLGQKGEIPMLDPEADAEHAERTLDRLAKQYEQIKPKRLDMSEFKNDVRDLISIYKDKPEDSSTMTAFQTAFRELYPTVQTNTGYKSIRQDIERSITHLLGHAISMEQGDTSNYGYRVDAWQKSKGI